MTGKKIKRDAPGIMASLGVGSVVRSVAGRDRNRVFIVTSVTGDGKHKSLAVADGELRVLSAGKRKNPLHIRAVGVLDDSDIKELESHPSDRRIAELCRRFDENEKFQTKTKNSLDKIP